jgi:hypothetical protein
MLKIILGIVVWIIMIIGIVAFFMGASSYGHDKEE